MFFHCPYVVLCRLLKLSQHWPMGAKLEFFSAAKKIFKGRTVNWERMEKLYFCNSTVVKILKTDPEGLEK